MSSPRPSYPAKHIRIRTTCSDEREPAVSGRTENGIRYCQRGQRFDDLPERKRGRIASRDQSGPEPLLEQFVQTASHSLAEVIASLQPKSVGADELREFRAAGVTIQIGRNSIRDGEPLPSIQNAAPMKLGSTRAP